MRAIAIFALAGMGLVACGETTVPVTSEGGATQVSVAPEENAVAEEPAARQGVNEITCSYPVSKDDTAQNLLERFGKDARVEDVIGREGEDLRALVLWPDDIAKRLELEFADEAMTKPLTLRRQHDSDYWEITGLSKGSSLAEVETRNGGPFQLFGYEWDYGGKIVDWQGGKLAELPGGCWLGAAVGPSDNGTTPLPDELIGDRIISSQLDSLKILNPVVFDLWIEFRNFESVDTTKQANEKGISASPSAG